MQRMVYLNAVEYFSFQMFYSFLTCACNFGTVFAQSIEPFFTLLSVFKNKHGQQKT